MAAALDSRELRQAFGLFPTGVVAVCADTGQERIGFAASSFVPVSLDPPLVAFCVQNTSTTWPRLRTAGSLGISVLGEVHDVAARTLAAKSGDRFDGLTTVCSQTGALFIEGANLWLDTRIADEIEAGDHSIIVLRIDEMQLVPHVYPLVFHQSRFSRLTREEEAAS
jgi:flavin reductase (DIM6/NTAB) family NADH-FMN oxidoreductase RutF